MTPAQSKALSFIRNYIDQNQHSPSYREISDHLGLKSASRVVEIISALSDLGYVTHKKHRARSVKIVNQTTGITEQSMVNAIGAMNAFQHGRLSAAEAITKIRPAIKEMERMQ